MTLNLNELRKIAEASPTVAFQGDKESDVFYRTFSPTLILKLLDEIRDAREALIYIRSSDMSKYELGFDYGEDHKRLGKAKSGSRWITPEERAQVFLNKWKENVCKS